MKAVFDTNILIDYLNGFEEAKAELNKSYTKKMISTVTWMEVMVGVTEQQYGMEIESFLNHFEVIQTDQKISKTAVDLRQKHRMRLPDAIIWSTAINHDALLVTRNIKDFPQSHVNVRIPYSL